MLRRLSIHRTEGEQRALTRAVLPVHVSMAAVEGGTTIEYSDGAREAPACLRCPDAPCLRYQPDELQPEGLPSFPSDGDLSVCPTGAFGWPIDVGVGPVVMPDLCIGCGLCIDRCPVGAIQLGTDGTARVLDDDTPTLKCTKSADALHARVAFERAARSARMAVASDTGLERLAQRISSTGMAGGPKFPNLLTRNLLAGLGWRVAMRRSGDTNIRMDLLAQRASSLCVTEVEFSDAVIDAPRNVLDGIAVLRARYRIPEGALVGLVVAGALPNQRSEYWHVISDIEKALGVRVHTATAAALVLLLWEGRTLEKLPFAALGQSSIRGDIEENIGHTLNLSQGVASALEARK